jgi:septum formation protein
MTRERVIRDRATQEMHDFVYLASQSPRRRQLLEQIGVRHDLLLAGDDEDAEALEAQVAGELPADYCVRVTRLKVDAAVARLLRRGLPPAPVLCADTTVALGRRIFGKPADAADAVATLTQLSGRTHRVITAVAVAAPVPAASIGSTHIASSCPTTSRAAAKRPAATAVDWPVHERLSVSTVRFASLPAAAIDDYVASGEPFGKAGAYAIQSRLAAWIERIGGSYSGIMGLPLHETAQLLVVAGVTVRMKP